MSDVNAILAIAYRDLLKFLRDRARIGFSLIFRIFFIGILGGSLQSNLGAGAGYNLIIFTFTGVLAQTLFQSTAGGVISLIEDRQNDFSQAMFVAPISRYSIVFGKILGETLVALPQGLAVMAFALLIGVPLNTAQVVGLVLAGLAACLFGGAFGVMVISSFTSQRTANQIFPFIMFPQFFLAGVFAPIKVLPFYLEALSRISPLRYAVDLTRGLYYRGLPEYPAVVLASPVFNIVLIAALFAVCMTVGTWLFVRGERNR
jgi:ABC-2 type transport system permease protein